MKKLYLAAAISFLFVSAGVAGSDKPEQVETDDASISYLSESLWWSLGFKPSFKTVISNKGSNYSEGISVILQDAGYLTNQGTGVTLSAFEQFAGHARDYHPLPPGGKTSINGLEIGFSALTGIVLAKLGLFNPSQVGSIAAANTVGNVGLMGASSLKIDRSDKPSISEETALQDGQGNDLLTVVQVCNNGGKCVVSAARSKDPSMTIDHLREINIKEGVARALSLTK